MRYYRPLPTDHPHVRRWETEALGSLAGIAIAPAGVVLPVKPAAVVPPWQGGWQTKPNGKLTFRMPPYPGVDY